MKHILLIALIVLGCGAANAQHKLTPLNCPGSTASYLLSINNHGLMVGATNSQSDPLPHAIIYSKGNCTPLAPQTVLGKTFSIASGVNDRGDVVGVYFDDSGFQHGFLLNKHGPFSTLDFPTANDTWATGINESGIIVGYWQIRDSSGNILSIHGFRWERGGFSEIMIEGSADTYVGGINARGDYGGFWDTDINSAVGHAYVYSEGKYSNIDFPFPEAVGGQVNSINAKGQIAATYWDANVVQSGVVKFGTAFVAVKYPGAVATALWGINNAGQITGWYFDSSFTPHAFYGKLEP